MKHTTGFLAPVTEAQGLKRVTIQNTVIDTRFPAQTSTRGDHVQNDDRGIEHGIICPRLKDCCTKFEPSAMRWRTVNVVLSAYPNPNFLPPLYDVPIATPLLMMDDLVFLELTSSVVHGVI